MYLLVAWLEKKETKNFKNNKLKNLFSWTTNTNYSENMNSKERLRRIISNRLESRSEISNILEKSVILILMKFCFS